MYEDTYWGVVSKPYLRYTTDVEYVFVMCINTRIRIVYENKEKEKNIHIANTYTTEYVLSMRINKKKKIIHIANTYTTEYVLSMRIGIVYENRYCVKEAVVLSWLSGPLLSVVGVKETCL